MNILKGFHDFWTLIEGDMILEDASVKARISVKQRH
jgi:hypothetical protein